MWFRVERFVFFGHFAVPCVSSSDGATYGRAAVCLAFRRSPDSLRKPSIHVKKASIRSGRERRCGRSATAIFRVGGLSDRQRGLLGPEHRRSGAGSRRPQARDWSQPAKKSVSSSGYRCREKAFADQDPGSVERTRLLGFPVFLCILSVVLVKSISPISFDRCVRSRSSRFQNSASRLHLDVACERVVRVLAQYRFDLPVICPGQDDLAIGQVLARRNVEPARRCRSWTSARPLSAASNLFQSSGCQM